MYKTYLLVFQFLINIIATHSGYKECRFCLSELPPSLDDGRLDQGPNIIFSAWWHSLDPYLTCTSTCTSSRL